MTQPVTSDTHDVQAREARVRDNITFIRKGMDEIVTREARALGWSPGDAKMIAASATLEYFGALERHTPPEQALRTAIEQADLKHVVRYVDLVAREGKTSMRHALRDVLVRRLDENDPRQHAALQAALRSFDDTILRQHSLEAAVTASRNAAMKVMLQAA